MNNTPAPTPLSSNQIIPSTAPKIVANSHSPLVSMDQVVACLGNDPSIQHQVFDLCRDLIEVNLPKLRQAILSGNVVAIQHIAHLARGSLGMLGLSRLQDLGEEIEYRQNEIGAACWQQRCEELYRLLEHLREELNVRLAA